MSQDINKEESLLAAFNERSLSALEEIYDKYYSHICMYAIELTRSFELSKDIANEVFIGLVQGDEKFGTIYSIKHYLYTKTHYACVSYCKLNNIPITKKHAEVFTDDEWRRIIELEELRMGIYTELLNCMQGNSATENNILFEEVRKRMRAREKE